MQRNDDAKKYEKDVKSFSYALSLSTRQNYEVANIREVRNFILLFFAFFAVFKIKNFLNYFTNFIAILKSSIELSMLLALASVNLTTQLEQS